MYLYAKVTLKKRNSGDNELSGKEHELTHLSEHNQQAEAVLVTKMIDKEGVEFGESDAGNKQT